MVISLINRRAGAQRAFGRNWQGNTLPQGGISRLRALGAARRGLFGREELARARMRGMAEQFVDWQALEDGIHRAQARALEAERRAESGVTKAGTAEEVLSRVIGRQVQNKRFLELFVRDLLGELPREFHKLIIHLGPERLKAVLARNTNFQRIIRVLGAGKPISSEEAAALRGFTADLRSSLVKSLQQIAQQEGIE